MAAPWSPLVKNQDFEMVVALEDYANPGSFLANPTLAAGDVKISKDGGAEANLATLPVVEPASSVGVKMVLSSTECNIDKGYVIFKDQTVPPQWCDLLIPLVTQQ